LFLILDDQLGFLEVFLECLVFCLGRGKAALEGGVDLFLTTPLLWAQGGKGAILALSAPGAEVRGVKPLTPEEGADLADLVTSVSLTQDAELVLGGVLPALCFLRDLRTGDRRGRGRAWYRRATPGFP
jgi:hypothetical protein